MNKPPKDSFRQVYEKCSLPLRKKKKKKLGYEEQLVDDIFQETMLAAYKSWGTFEHKSKYLTWMCRIALNKIADYYRSNIHDGSRVLVPLIDNIDSLLEVDLTPEEETVLVEFRRHVRICLSLLPEEYRRILELRYFKNYSYEKIATILDASERSVEGKLYRARKALADIWEMQSFTQPIFVPSEE